MPLIPQLTPPDRSLWSLSQTSTLICNQAVPAITIISCIVHGRVTIRNSVVAGTVTISVAIAVGTSTSLAAHSRKAHMNSSGVVASSAASAPTQSGVSPFAVASKAVSYVIGVISLYSSAYMPNLFQVQLSNFQYSIPGLQLFPLFFYVHDIFISFFF